ncbi:hypothetical protein M9H77_26375 [Catharanthus roseus]|uniref:Uncharacterized protein n=1 Tax=Catharanthus roseus TaxID=4058 RepID=A0ACC0A9H6_CATRO|nr:hypothetical protein M9H77_26375 [Catharanthus roseus]
MHAHLGKIVEYCKGLVTQPPFGDNDLEINCFISELVNDDEQTLFAADYLALKGIFSLSCEENMDDSGITVLFGYSEDVNGVLRLSIRHHHWMAHTEKPLVVKSIGNFIFKQGQVDTQHRAEHHKVDIPLDTILDGDAQKHHNKGDTTTNMVILKL